MLLTIYIPTYNRCEYLEILLDKLVPQIEGLIDCQVIVSDNCSPDNTKNVCQKFCNVSNFKYIRNETNIGSAANFKKAYFIDTEYLWLCGDDDIILEDSLERIFNVIKNDNNYGMVYLNSYLFRDDFNTDNIKIRKSINNELKPIGFFKEFGCDLTFMSSMIFNLNYFKNREILDKYQNHSFLQTIIAYDCLFNSNQSLYIDTPCLGAKLNDATGYSMYRVFGKELREVINYAIKNKYVKKNIAKKTYIKYVKKIVLPGIIGAKANGNKRMLQHKKEFICATNDCLSSYFCIYPLIDIPCFVYKFLRKVKRSLKRSK